MAHYLGDLWNNITTHSYDNTSDQGKTYVTDANPIVPPYSPDTEVVIVVCMLCVFTVVGTIGNGLVLYVFSRTPSKLTSTVFILALAGTDFVTCILIIPWTAIAIHLDYFVIYDVACKAYQFFITCTVPLSAFIMVAIAVDRYICICHPFVHIMTVKRAKVIVVVLVVFACILGLITSLGFSLYQLQTIVESNNQPNTTPTIIMNSSGIDVIDDSPPVIYNSHAYLMNHSMSDDRILINKTVTIKQFNGQCRPSNVVLPQYFTDVYQKIYSCLFVLSLMVVLILYAMIYSSVTKQRAKRRAQKRGCAGKKVVNTQCQTDESTMPLNHINKQAKPDLNTVTTTLDTDGQTVTTHIVDCKPNGVADSENQPINKSRPSPDANKDKKDHDRMANIKTALMLFIVTVVFIVAFLPSWLMAHRWLKFNTIVFYMYFVYNVANPVIYAFMNQMFRSNMAKIFSSFREYCKFGR